MTDFFGLKCIDTISPQRYLCFTDSASVRCKSKMKKWRITYYQDIDLYTIQPMNSDLFMSAEYIGTAYRRNSQGSRIVLSENVFYWIINPADPIINDGVYCIEPYWGKNTKHHVYLKVSKPNPMLSEFRARWKLIS